MITVRALALLVALAACRADRLEAFDRSDAVARAILGRDYACANRGGLALCLDNDRLAVCEGEERLHPYTGLSSGCRVLGPPDKLVVAAPYPVLVLVRVPALAEKP